MPPPWMSWSHYWTSPRTPHPRPQPHHRADRPTHKTKTSSRSVQKTSGLFDKDVTQEAELTKTYAKKDHPVSGSAADLLSALENGDAYMGEDSLLTGLDSSFLEGFTNISDFLMMTEDTDDLAAFMPDDVPLETIDMKTVQGLKRRRVSSSESLEAATSPVPNPDHNDYVCKRRRLASANSDTSEASTVPHVDTYRQRRQKNNVASKRSRQTRKQNFRNMASQATTLEIQNEELRKKIAEMEILTKKMKDTLIQRIARGK